MHMYRSVYIFLNLRCLHAMYTINSIQNNKYLSSREIYHKALKGFMLLDLITPHLRTKWYKDWKKSENSVLKVNKTTRK